MVNDPADPVAPQSSAATPGLDAVPERRADSDLDPDDATSEQRPFASVKGKLALWLLGAVAASVVGWLVSLVLTAATAAPALQAFGAKTLPGASPIAATVTFTVTNTGSALAGDCSAHLRLGNGKIIRSPAPVVPGNASQTFSVTYFKAEAGARALAHVWARCGHVTTNLLPAYAPASVALGAFQPQVARNASLTTISFHVQNTGDEAASPCRAILRFQTGKTIVNNDEPAVPASSFPTFTISFLTGASHRGPVTVWASCGSYSTQRISVRP